MTDFQPSEDQKMLREGFHDLLSGIISEQSRREALEGPGFAADVWSQIAAGGWLEIAIQDEAGDAGLALTLCLLSEEVGAHFLAAPFALTATFVAPLLSAAPTTALAVEDVTSGQTVVSAVLPDGGSPLAPVWSAVATSDGEDGTVLLSGRIESVLFAAMADWILVPFSSERGATEVAALRTNQAGVSIEEGEELDFARPTARLVLDSARVEPSELLGEPGEDHAKALGELLQHYLLCVDGECIGSADAVIRRTAGFVAERRQFGVPVGSFQAVKHLLANAYGEMEIARGMTHHLAWQIDHDSSWPVTDLLCSRLAVAEMYPAVVEACIQCHGGAGFTWEQGLHGPYRQALSYRHHLFSPKVLRRALWESIYKPTSGEALAGGADEAAP